jgi:hypothetical protein
VGRKKRGGFIFETYSGDHRPYHVHVYRGDEFVGRFDIENQIPMDGKLSSRVLKYLEELGYKRSKKGD